MPKIRRAKGIGAVKRKQKSRSAKARAVDARKTAKTTYTSTDRPGMKSWLKRPGKSDVSGVDTKGKGAGRVKKRAVAKKGRCLKWGKPNWDGTRRCLKRAK